MLGASQLGIDQEQAASSTVKYNGAIDLQALKNLDLNGCTIQFNGTYSLRDLRGVDFTGAVVLLNGEHTSPSKFKRQHSRYQKSKIPIPGEDIADLPGAGDNSISSPAKQRISPPQSQAANSTPHRGCTDVKDGIPSGHFNKKPSGDDDYQPPETSSLALEGKPANHAPEFDCEAIILEEFVSETTDHQGRTETPRPACSDTPAEKYKNGGNSSFHPREPDLNIDEDISPDICKEGLEKGDTSSITSKEPIHASSISPTLNVKEAIVESPKEIMSAAFKESNMPPNSASSRQGPKLKLQTSDQVILPPNASSKNRTRLPKASPLGNLVKLALVEEEIVQSRVQLAMAKHSLEAEQKQYGAASSSSQRNVGKKNDALSRAIRKRDAIRRDEDRFTKWKKEASTPTSPSSPGAVDDPLVEERNSQLPASPAEISSTSYNENNVINLDSYINMPEYIEKDARRNAHLFSDIPSNEIDVNERPQLINPLALNPIFREELIFLGAIKADRSSPIHAPPIPRRMYPDRFPLLNLPAGQALGDHRGLRTKQVRFHMMDVETLIDL